MTNQQELVKQVIGKNKLSNIMLCCKVVFDLLPQVLLIHMIGLYFLSELTRNQIRWECSVILICFIAKAICSYLSTWSAHKAAYTCLTELRLQIIRHLKKLSLGFFQERKIGDLTNIVHHDVEQVEGYLAHGLPEIMSATILPIAVFFIMLWVDYRLALVMIAGIPLMWITKTISAPIWAKNFKIYSDSVTRMQENVMEYVSCISVIKAFGKEETKTERTIQAAKDYDYWVKKSMAGISVPMGLIILFMESGIVLVMILGTYLLSIGQIKLSNLILSIVLGGLFTSSIAKVATFQHYRIVFNQAMNGIWSILGVEAPKRPGKSEKLVNGEIVISNLDFAYNKDEKVLDNINLCIPKGTKTALVGSSGCGKSTLANLLMGFWEPTKGNITIGGKDTKKYSEKEVNSLFSIVQQEVFLFNLSMEENIRIGKPDVGAEEIIEAAKKARIHDFIISLPNGYQTLAGETGVKFSGGEKQRISIARMILKDAPIIILDEATASLDTENETYIQAAIDSLSQDKTVIMIAHHLNTIQDADQIVVMDSGRIVDIGKHKELLEHCALYKTMVENQNKVDNWKIKEVSL
ncbi:MAG: ABC transporter ATP-binding protein [Spirochaetales bacterium]|nr:ABC transporter ATP-binding protein [Spirochaetales bacterium]